MIRTLTFSNKCKCDYRRRQQNETQFEMLFTQGTVYTETDCWK